MYDMALVRPAPIPTGLVLRLLNDGKKRADTHYIREPSYEKDPLAFAKHLISSSAALNKMLEDAVSQVCY